MTPITPWIASILRITRWHSFDELWWRPREGMRPDARNSCAVCKSGEGGRASVVWEAVFFGFHALGDFETFSK